MRADVYLFAHGLTPSRELAKKLITGGCVELNGKKLKKPSDDIDESTAPSAIKVTESPEARYVSRGGLKLEAALREFNIDVSGMRGLDIGASTGGFTDCLLKHGALSVCAVDSGHGQLSPRLGSDSRVVSFEGINARDLSADDVGTDFDIAVMDVSFISQTYILPRIPRLLTPGGSLVSLIKPQFEVGRHNIGKGGVVRSEKVRLEAVNSVCIFAESCGFEKKGLITSPIEGGDGNIEYIAWFKRSLV